jgi:hypothetical protein
MHDPFPMTALVIRSHHLKGVFRKRILSAQHHTRDVGSFHQRSLRSLHALGNTNASGVLQDSLPVKLLIEVQPVLLLVIHRKSFQPHVMSARIG